MEGMATGELRKKIRVLLSKRYRVPQDVRVRDFLALGVGTIVSASILRITWMGAANMPGSGVNFFLIAALVAGLVAFAYASKCRLPCHLPGRLIHGLMLFSVNSSGGLPAGRCS